MKALKESLGGKEILCRFTKIAQPILIGNVEIKNRLAMAPMGIIGLLEADGGPGQRAIDYYIERARGGVGLIITGLFKVENSIEASEGYIPLISPQSASSFVELAEAVHAFGAKIFVQLTAGFGRVANPRRLNVMPVSASPIPYYWQPDLTCRPLRTNEVEAIVKQFGTAAEMLASAGIDGIELHGHEGYLFDQFTTAVWNQRKDKYGGNLKGRLTFPIEALKSIKKSVGSDFPVQYRFGLKHYMKGPHSGALPGEKYRERGRNIREGLRMAKILQEAGFDALHVDAGCYDSWYWPHPPIYQSYGCMSDMAAEVKKRVNIPVIAVGKLGVPELAERILVQNQADLIAVGRSLLADPFWMRKVEEMQPQKIRPCIYCHDGCMDRLLQGRPLSCAVNPCSGRERTYSLRKSCRRKRVIVVGGGVAGLEAARVCLFRGHQVTLYEKTNSLGGNLIPASVPKFKRSILALVEWYQREVHDLGINLKMGCEATLDLVRSQNADSIIIATGAKPLLPVLPGIENGMVVTAPDLLMGLKECGDDVIVVGGGLVGCEAAIWLAQQGRKVAIVEMMSELMSGGIRIPHMTKMMVSDMLKSLKIKVMVQTSLAGIGDNYVQLADLHGDGRKRKVDTVVLCTGVVPERELYKALAGSTPNLHLIGDAREARNIMGAVWDAYEVARAV